MTATDDAVAVQEMIARQKITDVLTRYARGIDRCDLDTLLGVFWPDSKADYGSGAQLAAAWCRATLEALKGMLRTQHSISNITIKIDGDEARAETYCHAYHELESPSGRREMVVGGRYLDRLERRDGEWRIAQRTYVMDWNRNTPSTSLWDEGMYRGLNIRGGRWPDDPLRGFLADDGVAG